MRFEPGFVKEASRVRHAFLWLGPFSWPKGECGASLAGPFWAYFSENLTNFAERGVILEQVGNEGQFALTKNADSFYLWSYGPIFGGQHGESLGCFLHVPVGGSASNRYHCVRGALGIQMGPLARVSDPPTRSYVPISHHHFSSHNRPLQQQSGKGEGRGSLFGRSGDKRCVLVVFRRVPVVSGDANRGPGGVCSHRGRLAGEDDL